MAKKQESKTKKRDSDEATSKTAKSKAAGRKSGEKSANAKSARKSDSKNKRDTRSMPALSGLADPLPKLTKAAAKGSSKAKKAAKDAKKGALKFVPEASSASSGSHTDVVNTAREIGGQIMSMLNTETGRAITAEVLVYMAKSLTRAAANTEPGRDASSAMLNAGAKIGAVMANAGAKAMEPGSSAAQAGGTVSASDLAREVAQAAVSTVGGVVLETAAKVVRKRGKAGQPEGANKSEARPGGGGASARQTGSDAPRMPS